MSTAPQRITRVRRSYNQWVANQTLEDYALRFTAKSARKWSVFVVVNAALGAISFLALEAIGGAITLAYGFQNAVAAILAVSVIIFATSLPIAYTAARHGIDIDLLTRGAGFGYIGSTVTSLIYACFTFIYFAIEAAIMSLALELCFGLPQWICYILSAVLVIPLVTHGFTFISRLQLWSQPVWLLLHALPFIAIALKGEGLWQQWVRFPGTSSEGGGFDIYLFGAASLVLFSLIAQIGEQVDLLRFLPRRDGHHAQWLFGVVTAGPGWIVIGALKLLAGSFLSVLALHHMVPFGNASEPTQMYMTAFSYVFSSPDVAMVFTAVFVIISQVKINVTNAYAGSIAWSNFFSRLTRSHPGRVVWLVFNVAIALMLMQLGIFKALERILGLYSILAIAWVGALVADLVINKPMGLSPRGIEFKRASLYDVNPVGVGAMLLAALAGACAYAGAFGALGVALASYVTLAVAFVASPLIAYATGGRYYLARDADAGQKFGAEVECCICEHTFEAEDIASCPAYDGPICSLCCLLDSRCHERCKLKPAPARKGFASAVLRRLQVWIASGVARYVGVYSSFLLVIGAVILLVYQQQVPMEQNTADWLRSVLWSVFALLALTGGIVAWFFVLTQESRRVAEQETSRQTELLVKEIEAHQRTDALLQKAKETAEAQSQAKSRYVTGLSHELRTPLNAILGYAQLLERDRSLPSNRANSARVIRRSAEHLSGLIDGLLDVSRIEAGHVRLNRDRVRLREFFPQVADMFRLQAEAKGLEFRYEELSPIPGVVYADESRLRQVLINLLSNALKFTDRGYLALRIRYRNQIISMEVEDSGQGIREQDLTSIFEPFVRAQLNDATPTGGIGLGLTITRNLVNIMGGSIEATSVFGKGSLFRVKLMLSEDVTPQGDSEKRREIIGYEGERRSVLITDDDENHRAIMFAFLKPLGFHLLQAADGPACLAEISTHEPDVVLLDVLMPRSNGWEVAAAIRERGHTRCKIIMLSAHLGDAHRVLSPERAHDLSLLKPLDFTQLIDALQKVLGLTWIYAAESESEAERVGAIVMPPPQHVSDLLHLAQIGYVHGIQSKLNEVAALGSAYDAFVASARRLVDRCDIKGFIAALQNGRFK